MGAVYAVPALVVDNARFRQQCTLRSLSHGSRTISDLAMTVQWHFSEREPRGGLVSSYVTLLKK